MLVYQPKRIFFLDPAGQHWGSEKSLLLLLRSLDKRRCLPAVCLPRRTPLAADLRALGIQYYPWFWAELHRTGVTQKGAALVGLYAAALAFRPDIIHLNQAGAVHFAAVVAKLLRRPLVVHVRLAEDASLVGRRVNSWNSTVCIANSRFVAEQLRIGGIPKQCIHMITNPIQTSDEFLPEPARRKWQIGFVGRLSEDKGIDLFLRCCQIVAGKKPSVRIVVVGGSGGNTSDGRDYLEAMKDLAVNLGLGSNIDFLGFRDDVHSLMKQIAVFVMPSKAEPWGRVVAEAMVAGAVVVAFDAGGPREMIENGITGILVEQDDLTAMADAVMLLIDRPAFAQKMTVAGRLWVERECDPRTHASQVEKVYNMLMESKG